MPERIRSQKLARVERAAELRTAGHTWAEVAAVFRDA
jgi:hypothetical protein